MRLLFVCLGNICRSPTAEGVMRTLIEQAGQHENIELDSAGTGAWHLGSPPHARATAAAASHGTILQGSARQVTEADFEEFDLLLAMDRENMRALRQLARDPEQLEKVRMLREFDPASAGDGELDVPDPYYGADGRFDEVYEIVHSACAGLLERIQAGQIA